MRALLVLGLFAVSMCAVSAASDKVVCYFASWTVYRNGNGKFEPTNVDTNLCTHVVFSFVGLEKDGTVKVLDPWEANDDGLGGISKLIALKKVNPKLKILVSMGGWNEGSATYSMVAADANMRSIFAQSVLQFVQTRGFDGFDLDWEYPAQRGGSPADKANYVLLLSELKQVLGAKNLLLTATVAGAVQIISASYDVPEIFKILDFANIMSYDYHGSFDPYVGHYAPLYASSKDGTPDAKLLNVNASISAWLSAGAPSDKVVLGISTYGRTFTLKDPSNHDLYAPSLGGGVAGPYTQEPGVIGFNEVCELHSDMDTYWDDEQQVPHKVKGNQWYGYEDERSAGAKAKYAKDLKLGGMLIWALDTDDFRGTCAKGAYPLLTAMNKGLGLL